jgi:hypothetical protein
MAVGRRVIQRPHAPLASLRIHLKNLGRSLLGLCSPTLQMEMYALWWENLRLGLRRSRPVMVLRMSSGVGNASAGNTIEKECGGMLPLGILPMSTVRRLQLTLLQRIPALLLPLTLVVHLMRILRHLEPALGYLSARLSSRPPMAID